MLSPQAILSHSCKFYGVPLDTLLGYTRAPATVRARACCVYLFRKTGWSYPEIAPMLSARSCLSKQRTNHSTCITARRRTTEADIAEFERVAAEVPRSFHRRIVIESYIKRHYKRTRDAARRDADLALLASLCAKGQA